MLSGVAVAEAHTPPALYYNVIADVLEYERTEYAGFDLVQIRLSVENLADIPMETPEFRLGGPPEYEDDPVDNPDTPIRYEYGDSTYADVRARGGSVLVEECASVDRFSPTVPGGTVETSLCFMIGKDFQPDGLLIGHNIVDPHHHSASLYATFEVCAGGGEDHTTHQPPCSLLVQVIPFHAESDYCFDRNFDWCNADNVQPIDGRAVPAPSTEPEPVEPPTSATLLHAMYNNHTGTLTLVFDSMVVASNPDRVLLIHDIDAYIDDGASPDLGDSEMYTVDNKRQSAVLAFALDDTLRLAVTESLRSHGDLVLYIETGAIYAADGFVDITDGSPVWVPDVMVVR